MIYQPADQASLLTNDDRLGDMTGGEATTANEFYVWCFVQRIAVLAHGFGVRPVQAADILGRHGNTRAALWRIFSATTSCFSLSS